MEPANTHIVVLTGPESVGKSTIARQLAQHFACPLLPEYARHYIEHLGRPYTWHDVVHIARQQIAHEDQALRSAPRLLMVDTDLLITQVWFDVVYGRVPSFVEERLHTAPQRLHLLLDTAPPWQADPVRENGGTAREALWARYRHELDTRQLPYALVGGLGQQRVHMAIEAVERYVASRVR